MGDNVKLSRWGIGMLMSMIGVVVALLIQTAVAAKWAGSVSERLETLTRAVDTTKNDLTHRIERIEDRTAKN